MVQSQAPNFLPIGRLAAAAGVGVETVRFYQRRGLLGTPSRADGIRRYDSDDLRRLKFIRQAQTAGFTLKEIRELLDLDDSQDRDRAREMARSRIAALDEQMAALKTARDSLVRLAQECGKGGKGPCPILASFDQSSRSRSTR